MDCVQNFVMMIYYLLKNKIFSYNSRTSCLIKVAKAKPCVVFQGLVTLYSSLSRKLCSYLKSHVLLLLNNQRGGSPCFIETIILEF